MSLDSWRSFPALQQPQYADQQKLQQVTSRLRMLPGLVELAEISQLQNLLAAAGRGEYFVLMGGDCAETFNSTTGQQISLQVQTIMEMAEVFSKGTSLPVVQVGRIAGQYAKPRSLEFEEQNGVRLPVYRGDAVNGIGFTAGEREADPLRLLEMYNHCSSTLRLIREFTSSQQSGSRDLGFYVSHEALLLEYESAMLRLDSLTGSLYASSGHFLWIGERTRFPEGAHVELLRQVRNPIGVKLGATATADDVVELALRLNPDNEPGRFTAITRMGAEYLNDRLPPILERVKAEGLQVTWLSDPMHGNTIQTQSGLKTRHFDTIMSEIEQFFAVHEDCGTVAAGLHIELTGNAVTEVLGGAGELREVDLHQRYESLVDPRLNYQQALEVADRVAALL